MITSGEIGAQLSDYNHTLESERRELLIQSEVTNQLRQLIPKFELPVNRVVEMMVQHIQKHHKNSPEDVEFMSKLKDVEFMSKLKNKIVITGVHQPTRNTPSCGLIKLYSQAY